MKKALQGFSKGAELGSILGFLGAELLIILMLLIGMIEDSQDFYLEVGIWEAVLGTIVIILGMSIYIALPGLAFGLVIGGVLGILSERFLNYQKTQKRILYIILLAILMHLLAVAVVFGFSYFYPLMRGAYIEGYINTSMISVPIYLLAAAWFGYIFPTYTLRFPKVFSVDLEKWTKEEIKRTFIRSLCRVWKAMMVGVVVGLFFASVMQLYDFIRNFETNISKFLRLSELFLYPPVFGTLGGLSGLGFGVVFLVIPEKRKGPVKVLERFILVGFFGGIIPYWILSETDWIFDLTAHNMMDWLFPIKFSGSAWEYVWAPVFFAGFLVMLFGVFLYDRLQVWTPKFLLDTQNLNEAEEVIQ